MKNVERFIRYVKIDTQSDDKSLTSPSTSKQNNLAKILVDELIELGVEDAKLNEFGIVTGSIKANTSKNIPAIGFISHIDTALDLTGTNVRPQVIENYDGKDIKLSETVTMKVKDFPFLASKEGETLVVTSGDTLLGADDKAGIAEIMGLVEYIQTHPDFEHGDIKIAFTPDEEIGRGTENFDVKSFGAKFAYTVDGGPIFDVEYENFNAASAHVEINGVSIHPGSAKDKMINSLLVAMEFNAMLPKGAIPSLTQGYEGFNHILNVNGNVEKTTMDYIIRNHDKNKLEEQKKDFIRIANYLNEFYHRDIVTLTIKDSYKNMREYLEKDMYIVDIAKEAITKEGLTPSSHPIRGGTDGANLTYMGLPCPNLGTGGYNAHGKFEFLVVSEMDKMVKVLINIVDIVAKRDW
jgi:tripeptide aminopeptidase